jgi:hypothetical protein
MVLKKSQPDMDRLDRIVADAWRNREQRQSGYREQALKLNPWICGRCGREFTRKNLHELTVHHKDHDHHNNPPDGSNWELLCLYCHDNEHMRFVDETKSGEVTPGSAHKSLASHKPFADLKDMLKSKE